MEPAAGDEAGIYGGVGGKVLPAPRNTTETGVPSPPGGSVSDQAMVDRIADELRRGVHAESLHQLVFV